MVISIILVSSDSSEDSVGTPAGRVILFGTIPTTIPDTTPSVTLPTTYIDTTPILTVSPIIPPSPDYTPTSPDYSPASDTEFDPSEDPSSDHIPPLPATHHFFHRSMTLQTVIYLIHHHHLPMIYHSLRLPFLLRASSRLFSDHSLPVSSLGTRSSHRLCSLVSSVHRSHAAISERPSHDSSSASPSRKRSRSPVAFVPLFLPIHGALSSAHADLLPPPKRIMRSESVMDLEDSLAESFEQSRSKGTDLEMYADVEGSDMLDIEPKIQAEIDKCVAYADALRASGVDVRVEAVTVARDDVETSARDLIMVCDDGDTPPVVSKVIKSIQRDQGHRIVVTGQQCAIMFERICELEQDNRRPRDIVDIESQRVTQFRRKELRVQRELRQIRHLRFYGRMRIARLEACDRRHLVYRQCPTHDLEHRGRVKELTNKLIADWQER
ncbi:hypothetical protein Tco_1204536 [Tanacetum coccineum]